MLYIKVYLVISFGVANYTIWFECYTMGFKTLHGKETIDIESISNYRDVGFGLIVDTRMAPLMHIWVWGSPSLGLGSMKHLIILLGLLFIQSHLCAVDEGDFQVDRGKAPLGFSSIVVILQLGHDYHTSHLDYCWWLEVTWLERSSVAQSFTSSSWVIP